MPRARIFKSKKINHSHCELPCIELKKFCKWCRKHTLYKEMKK